MTSVFRRQWWTQVVQGHQKLASDNPKSFDELVANLAALVWRLPEPRNRVEEMCARYLLERAVIRKADVDSSRTLAMVRTIQDVPWPSLGQRMTLVTGLRQQQSLVQKVQSFVDLRYPETCRLADVAVATGASIRTLTKAFRATFGCSVHSYLRLTRLKAALTLVSQTDEKLEAIAAAVGFKSASSLHRQLRWVMPPYALKRRENRTIARAALKLVESALRESRQLVLPESIVEMPEIRRNWPCAKARRDLDSTSVAVSGTRAHDHSDSSRQRAVPESVRFGIGIG